MKHWEAMGTRISLYKDGLRSSRSGAAKMNPTRNHEVVSSIPGLTQWVKDPALHELWCRSQMQLGSFTAVV